MNAVVLTGHLQEIFDKGIREFAYDIPFADEKSNEKRHIKVKYWTNQKDNRLTMLPRNSRVLIHGHLDEHEIFGTILLAEELEVIWQS